MKEHNIQREKKEPVFKQKQIEEEDSLNTSYESSYESIKDPEEMMFDSYGDRKLTTLPVYLENGNAGIETHVVHDKQESYTMHSLKEQLAVLNTKTGVGSTNPIENAAVNTYRNGKFLLTGILYNLTHIFSWTKRQRQRKKAVAKSMGTALVNFGKNLLKTVGGVVASPLITTYGAAKYIKNKYVDKDSCLQGESITHEFCKKFYGYLWGGVLRNTMNTVFMGATLPFWLVGGTLKTLWKAVRHGEFKGFQKSFDLPTPMLPVEWEDYYERFALGGAITKGLEKTMNDESGKMEREGLKNTWKNFCGRIKSHFTRFKEANWHSFITGDMRNYSRSGQEAVDYNNMQQI